VKVHPFVFVSYQSSVAELYLHGVLYLGFCFFFFYLGLVIVHLYCMYPLNLSHYMFLDGPLLFVSSTNQSHHKCKA
jgi:hypothetical protein